MITSVSNPKIKNLISLKQKSKARKEQNVFIAEGAKMFEEAPVERIREVYVSESFLNKGAVREKLETVGYEVLSDDLMQKVSDTQTPQGILCVVEQLEYKLKDVLIKKYPLLLLLEDIQDPGNLGTMIRTAEGAGVDGVIMSKGTVDIYNPKVIRSTMGSIYRLPFLYTEDFILTLKELQGQNMKLYAAHLKGEKFYHQLDYTEGTGFLIGNEGNGLKAETAEAADEYVKIPMQGQVESLNAAVASAILMYEAARQRMI